MLLWPRNTVRKSTRADVRARVRVRVRVRVDVVARAAASPADVDALVPLTGTRPSRMAWRQADLLRLGKRSARCRWASSTSSPEGPMLFSKGTSAREVAVRQRRWTTYDGVCRGCRGELYRHTSARHSPRRNRGEEGADGTLPVPRGSRDDERYRGPAARRARERISSVFWLRSRPEPRPAPITSASRSWVRAITRAGREHSRG